MAIERDATAPGIAEAERHGITVVLGDAKEVQTLAKARAFRAMNVLAVCSGDDTNIAIAMTVQHHAMESKSAPQGAECLLLLSDPVLRETLVPRLSAPAGPGGFRIKVGGLDVPDMLARRTLQDYPLDFAGIGEHSPHRVHLVVLGTCELGFALALKALQLGQFANRLPLTLTIVGQDAQKFLNDLRNRHAHVQPWYGAHAIEPRPNDAPLPQRAIDLIAPDDFVTVAICAGGAEGGDDRAESQAVLAGMAVAQALKSAKEANRPACAQVLVHLRHKAGFVTLLDSAEATGGTVRIHAFGLIETLCNRDTLLREKQDALARALHAEYVADQDECRRKAEAEGKTFTPRPAHKDWELLPERFRESNRLAADHLAVKLRAMGLRLDVQGKPGAVESLPDPGNTLAMMEHERWCAEYWLNGWRLGPRKDDQKIHPDLKPWSDLPPSERYIDQNFVTKTVRVVESARMGIYRS